MFREFFASAKPLQTFLAWFGLVVFVAHSLFNAYIKWALNKWYERFYDLMQASAPDLSTDLESKRGEVVSLIWDFVGIVAPVLVVHPVAKLISSVWRFKWRVSLIESYLAHYDASLPSLEGTAQRIQEDTARFEEGIYSAFNVVLDSVLTLIVFLPLLIEQGKIAKPEWVDDGFDAWMAYGAVQASVSGLFVSMWVGRKLVNLEVENQKVEARLRTKLVILEESPMSLVEDSVLVAFPPDVEVVQASMSVVETTETTETTAARVETSREGRDGREGRVSRDGQTECDFSPSSSMRVSSDWVALSCFRRVLKDLWTNYRQLFLQFTYFNTWISIFDQTMTILPYAFVAPLMFADDPSRRITLGQLVKITNAFSRVFDSLAVVSQSWASINDFRSVIRRLREFEKRVYERRAFNKKNVYGSLDEVSIRVASSSASATQARSRARNGARGDDDDATMHDVEL